MDFTFLEKHEYFYEKKENEYFFKENEEIYEIFIDLNIGEVLWETTKAEITSVDETPFWYRELYFEAFLEADKKRRIRRIANGEKLAISDILYYYTLPYEKKIKYNQIDDGKYVIFAVGNEVENIQKAFENERYDIKLEKQENDKTFFTVEG